MKYVGRQMVDFVDRDGNRIQGIKLHLVGLDNRVEGEACITQFINASSPLYNNAVTLPFGDVFIEYGPRGSVQSISSCK